ncbi:MAG TPA: 5-oxoprolinase subunit PxpA [Thermoanaerobaculia bacterium]
MIIDLSADLGEGAPREDEVWPLIHAANVACGGHVGDEQSMHAAVLQARKHDVRLGAHPSYPDREHFGRRSITMPAAQLHDALREQLLQLYAIAAREGLALQHVKPHGALYNDAHHDAELATVIIDAMHAVDPSLSLVAPDTSAMAEAARGRGTNVIREAFADRRYNADGSLLSRKEAGSLLTVDEARGQALLLARESAVIARDGSRLPIAFDTICIHADMEGAVERLRAIRAALS